MNIEQLPPLEVYDEKDAATSESTSKFEQALMDSSVDRFDLRSQPPEQEFLIDGLLPKIGTGVLAGAQDLGKSHFLLQIAACLATGTGFFGRNTAGPSTVLFLTAEDYEDDIHRRLFRATQWLNGQRPNDSETVASRLQENLSIANLSGIDARLTARLNRSFLESQPFRMLLDYLSQTRPSLVILDPLSMFRAGSVNDDDEAALLARLTTTMQQLTGGFVLWSGHVTKSSAGSREDGIYSLSGSSTFENSVRWSATMRAPSDTEAKRFGWDELERLDWVRLYVPKMKGPKPKPIWLRREHGYLGGLLLEPPNPKPVVKRTGNQHSTKSGESREEVHQRVTPLLLAHIAENPKVTANHVETYMANRWRIGQRSLRDLIGDLSGEGHIAFAPREPIRLTPSGEKLLKDHAGTAE